MSIRLILGALVVLVLGGVSPKEDDYFNYIAPPPLDTNEVKYHYRYGVDDAASGVFTHSWEERFGAYVKGAYSLLEPDGSVRIVDYEVDGPKGFHAVVRTTPPGTSYLSFRQLSMSKQHHGPPPVNILTNNPNKPTNIEPKVPKKVIAKDLPPNFHSVKPDYFWGDLPHDYFDRGGHDGDHGRHQPSAHEHDRHQPSAHKQNRNQPSAHDNSRGHASHHEHDNHHHHGGHDHTREFPNPPVVRNLREKLSNEVKFGTTRNWRDAGKPPRDFMTPPNHDAKVMHYDRLKPGVITDVIYTG